MSRSTRRTVMGDFVIMHTHDGTCLADNDISRVKWRPLTIRELLDTLKVLLDEGYVNLDTVLAADSDPEGNGINPLRREYYLGSLVPDGMRAEFEDSDDKPAKALGFGAGYVKE